jgi:hypothetical protein
METVKRLVLNIYIAVLKTNKNGNIICLIKVAVRNRTFVKTIQSS